MSGVYPKNLGSKIQQISNYSANFVKINPNNSLTGLTNTQSGGSISIDLPPNSLLDLSTLSVHFDFETTPAHDGANGCRAYSLSRYSSSLIRLIRVEIGGSVVSEISDYNLINQIFSDYQYGIEASSKRILTNYDPLLKVAANGTVVNNIFNIPTATEADIKKDKRHLIWNNFLGFLGGNGVVKYIDTGITGNVRITFETAPAAACLILAAQNAVAGASRTTLTAATGPAVDNVPEYTMEKVYATIKKVQIDDGIYFNALSQSLASGIPFQYHFNSFMNTKSSTTKGDLTLRTDVSSGSVSMAFMTFYADDHATNAELPDIKNLTRGLEDADYLLHRSAKHFGMIDKKNCYCSNYFKRIGTHVADLTWYINGERAPMYQLKNPDIYDKLMCDMGIHDDVSSGIYVGINSYDSWRDNYWVASLRLSHVCEDNTFISGMNSQGIPLTLECTTTATTGALDDKVGQLWVMTDNILQVYAGRQINVVK
tara:strand:- start:154 stop:1605 length:1452 start_codon:yes stop_codon:yes gene_type:complete